MIINNRLQQEFPSHSESTHAVSQ